MNEEDTLQNQVIGTMKEAMTKAKLNTRDPKISKIMQDQKVNVNRNLG